MFVECDDDFGITVTDETIAVIPGELRPKGFVIVDFSIDDGMNLIVFVVERLYALITQIVDGKTAMSEC